MSETPFIITIDAEGDDLWAKPREITARNAQYLPRFQGLCERYGFKPVYLANYEMAMSDFFLEFGRDVIARGTGEIGMHLHAWNSPPLVPLTRDDLDHHPYLVEYPDQVMKDKIRFMTQLLEERFERKMVSHRAGRWAFDGRYAAMLLEEGYRVDCSVTPGVDWGRVKGDPAGRGGADYRRFPGHAYFIDPSDVARPAESGLLEVPMTVHQGTLYRRATWAYRIPLLRRITNRIEAPMSWLCPAPLYLEKHYNAMLHVARAARAAGAQHLEFMMHSSELMPGGSPQYRDAAAIDRLYERLEMLFDYVYTFCRGTTLQEFHAAFTASAFHSSPARRAPAWEPPKASKGIA